MHIGACVLGGIVSSGSMLFLRILYFVFGYVKEKTVDILLNGPDVKQYRAVI